jgi:hypothetical protein
LCYFLYTAGHPWSLELVVLPGTYVCIAQFEQTPSVDANDLFCVEASLNSQSINQSIIQGEGGDESKEVIEGEGFGSEEGEGPKITWAGAINSRNTTMSTFLQRSA